VGLFSGLLTLPLAPARGVVWMADQLRSEALRQWHDPATVRRELARVDEAYQRGELTETERDDLEDALVARLMSDRGGSG
jgi:hypothetical protein